MPIGYLVALVIPALATAAIIAPVPRSWAFGQLYWRLTFQINELPLIISCWVVAATALAAAQGVLNTPGGAVAASIAALTVAGLVTSLQRAAQSHRAAERALSDGLGRAWRAGLSAEAAARFERRRPWARLLLAPLAVRRRTVVRRADVSYGPAGRENLLDVYLPRSGRVTGPCLVHFHGGGYRSGRKNREARALIYRLADQGWVCVSANYRLARTAPYPAALVDAKRVIAWVRDHASSLGADPSTIFVAGSSAGAHLAAMAALTPNLSTLQPGFESVDTGVAGAICLYGFYGVPGWIERERDAPSGPSELLENAVPMFIAHGTHDSFVPVSVARDFVSSFRAAASDRPLVYLELPLAQHTFDLYHSVRFHAVVDAIDAFAAHLTSRREPRATSADCGP